MKEFFEKLRELLNNPTVSEGTKELIRELLENEERQNNILAVQILEILRRLNDKKNEL